MLGDTLRVGRWAVVHETPSRNDIRPNNWLHLNFFIWRQKPRFCSSLMQSRVQGSEERCGPEWGRIDGWLCECLYVHQSLPVILKKYIPFHSGSLQNFGAVIMWRNRPPVVQKLHSMATCVIKEMCLGLLLAGHTPDSVRCTGSLVCSGTRWWLEHSVFILKLPVIRTRIKSTTNTKRYFF